MIEFHEFASIISSNYVKLRKEDKIQNNKL